MNMDEFKEYVRRQRRAEYDQRNTAKDDKRERHDVAEHKQDECLHRDDTRGTGIEIQSAMS